MVEPAIKFKQLKLHNWRQFAQVDLQFHNRLTVLTGANGAGKSTILNLLSRHLGVERPYFSVPTKNSSGGISYLIGRLFRFRQRFTFSLPVPHQEVQVGEITYSSGMQSAISVPEHVGNTYALNIPSQQAVRGVPVSSHRLLSGYQSVDNIPFRGVPPQDAYDWFVGEARNRYMGGHSNRSLIGMIKQTLAAWAAIGEGNSVFQPDTAQRDAFDGFVRTLRAVLPKSLGFRDLSIRPPDIVLVTESGEFILDAASGGLTSIVELTALLYACTLRSDMQDGDFVVTIDEPENHLHPSLQRSLFPSLVTAFPKIQFIVATHSPFIVSSLKDSAVYVLRYESEDSDIPTERRRIVSERLDYAKRAGTASEILRQVLGLPTTLPEWVEQDLAAVVARYQDRDINAATLDGLRVELKDAGLNELFPEALSKLANKNDSAN
ncbi:AAA family ATPase [Bradyrhizobium sp. CCGUVB1N3]|uniref:AAA family ATPase n=1 Tax=Bradyrhizobium sp. CCGUVB1N3 TaxID=2949629 RepID=UPI0020B1CE2A|nr:AAA family ATPase [Bradyrhizobium sp. CCGUVB1N3]MCP3476509.1 AAA family ATPase [Bradyrhizobium sp. CCGUVB1N3]